MRNENKQRENEMTIRIPKIIHEFLAPITNRWADEQTFWSKHFEVFESHSKGLFSSRKFFLRTTKLFKEVA